MVGKLANAAQTDLLTGARGQLNRCPTFSVRCKQSVNLEGALYKTLARGPSGSIAAGKSDQASLLARLASIKAAIKTRVEKDKAVNWGTVDWYEYDSALAGTGYGNKSNIVPGRWDECVQIPYNYKENRQINCEWCNFVN